MRRSGSIPTRAILLVTALILAVAPAAAHERFSPAPAVCAEPPPAEPWPAGYLDFETPQCNPIALGRGRLYVVDTPGGRVVEMRRSGRIVRDIRVGLEPAGVAASPDGRTLYVTNHLSDSISVIDLRSWTVVATIQQTDPTTRLSVLDEPCGVAFSPDGTRAYVTLSQPNRLAVIDASDHSIERILDIPGEDPRAVAVSPDGRFVFTAAFESGNRTEVDVPGEEQAYRNGSFWWLGFLDLIEATLQQGGSTGEIDLPDPNANAPARPDDDVFVIDTSSWTITPIAGVATLLYAVAPSRRDGSLWVAATDHQNFLDGPGQLAGRPIRNELVRIAPGAMGWAGATVTALALDEDAAGNPIAGGAVPYALTETRRGELLVAAASSDVLVVLDRDRRVRARVPVGSMPRGVVSRGNRAWVYNRGDSTVSIVKIRQGVERKRVSFGSDPAPAAVEEGRRLFYSARFSSNGTFACASCHPDAHTDQLVWNLGTGTPATPNRGTQTVRGIAGTAPFHWDGSQADAATLVNGGVTGPVFQGSITPCEVERMATFIESVSFPPSPFRAPRDQLSADARVGAAIVRRGVWLDQDDQPITPIQLDPALKDLIQAILGPNAGPTIGEACAAAGCHTAPLWTSPRPGAIEPVTFRGMWDRNTWLHDGTSSKIATLEAANEYRAFLGHSQPYQGFVTAGASSSGFFTTFFRQHQADAATDPIATHPAIEAFIRELGTGTPGVLGRQVLFDGSPTPDEAAALSEIIDAAAAGKVTLRVDGRVQGEEHHWVWSPSTGTWIAPDGQVWTQQQLEALLQTGPFLLLVTADLPPNTATQPLLRTVVVVGETEIATAVNGKTQTFEFRGDGFQPGMWLLVEGVPYVQLEVIDSHTARHTEDPVNAPAQLYVLSLLNPNGLQSNEFPIPVTGTPTGPNPGTFEPKPPASPPKPL